MAHRSSNDLSDDRRLAQLRLALATTESLFQEYAEFRRERGEVDPVSFGGDALQDVAVDQPLDIIQEFERSGATIAVDFAGERAEQKFHLDDQRISLRIAFNGHLFTLQQLASLAEAATNRKAGWHYWDGARWSASAIVREEA
ncbi:hypothetical protein [Bosea sp. LC85]|uniref:hypothetical protein n=1 Tax=Bosea sp. LC85 TaxID=1502851 RepID=UPI001269D3E4|nr:hypothetical protein [Bosea sp. LC85]